MAPALDTLLRPPPGEAAIPRYRSGWADDGSGAQPFLAYETAIDVNWSQELEQLHEESSRTHFIDVHTRWALLDAIARRFAAGGAIVDVGCSSGYLLEDLRAAHPDALVIGVDLVAEGLRRAHGNVPDAPLLLANCTRLPFRDQTVDVIVSANVLEHVADDVRALRELRRALLPGGVAAIVVPAAPGLYDAYDRFLGHERRYARGELARKAREAGFDVESDGHLGALLFPAFWATKKVTRGRQARLTNFEREALVRRQIDTTQGSRLGELACRLERRLIANGRALPLGIRSLCVLRRPLS